MRERRRRLRDLMHHAVEFFFLLLLIRRRRSGDRKWHRAEGQDEQRDSRPCGETPHRIEWRIDVGGDRMAEAKGEQQHRPEQPAVPERFPQAGRNHDHQDASDHDQPRNGPMTAAEQRINHMAAIELAGGQKVQRGDKQPEPSRECHRMKVDADGVGIDVQNPLRESDGTRSELPSSSPPRICLSGDQPSKGRAR